MSNFKKTLACLSLFLLLLALVACNGGGQGAETTAPDTEPEVTEAPGPAYTAETTLFESFSDLKKNVALFKDQLPCERSTKGYYAANDGGEATYSLTASKPSGISIKVADGVFAKLKATEYVLPEQMGAYSDGEHDDALAINRAIALAKEEGLTLKLTDGDYKTAQTIQLSVDMQCNNSRISYYGTGNSQPAIEAMNDGVDITGALTVWMINNGTANSGERCAILYGDYSTGDSVHHCSVENLTVLGGNPDMNGILITGGSSFINIGTITAPEGTNVGRLVLLHWGGCKGHRYADPNDASKGMVHEAGALPTTHPHDVTIGKIDASGIKKVGHKDGDKSAITIAAGYNVTVDEIIVKDSCYAVALTGADMGFEFAKDPTVKGIGETGIYIKKITATAMRGPGIYMVGYPWFIQDLNANVNPELKVDEYYFEGVGNDSYGIAATGIAKLEVGKAVIKNAGECAIAFAKNCKVAIIGDLTVENCGTTPIQGESNIESLTITKSNLG